MRTHPRPFPSPHPRGLLLVALGVLGCGEPPADGDQVEDQQRAINRGQVETGFPAVGFVVGPGVGNCTGVRVAPNLALTARHCVPETGAMTYDGLPADAFSHKVRDLAALHMDTPSLNTLPMGNFIPQVGSTCTIVGFGKHLEPNGTFSSGIKRSALVTYRGIDNGDMVVRMQTGIADKGDSGGPLICGGFVVGVTRAKPDATFPNYTDAYYTPLDFAWVNQFQTPMAQATAVNGNQLKVFMRGPDNLLWRQDWTGSAWTTAAAMPGSPQLQGAATAVSWGSNRVDAFARGTDSRLWQTFWTGGTFSGFFPLTGGTMTGDPVAVSTGANRLDVVYAGFGPTGGIQMLDTLFNGSAWVTTAVPTNEDVRDRVSVVVSQGVVHAFWRLGTGALRHAARTGATTWSTPETLAGGTVFTDAPSAIAFSNRITVFGRTTDGRLATIEHNGTSWSGALFRFNVLIKGSPAAVVWGNTRVNVFYSLGNGALGNIWFDGSWHDNSTLTSAGISGSPSVVNWGTASPPNRLQVFARGMDGRLVNEFWDGSS